MNKDLTVGKPETVLWKFCIPLFGSIIFQQLYNIADSLVAGKFAGENALAAVGNSYEITLIFIAFEITDDTSDNEKENADYEEPDEAEEPQGPQEHPGEPEEV